MPVGYASGGYALPPKSQNPVRGYTICSVILGILAMGGDLFVWYTIDGVQQVRQILRDGDL